MKRKNGYKKGTIKHGKDILKIQSELWREVAEQYLNNNDGVYLEHIGYLCHVLFDTKPKYIVRKNVRASSNTEEGYEFYPDVRLMGTNGYRYTHTVLDFADTKRFFHLVLSDYLKSKARKLMGKGKRYRFAYNEVKTKMDLMKTWAMPKVYKDNKIRFLKK